MSLLPVWFVFLFVFFNEKQIVSVTSRQSIFPVDFI